MTWVLTVVVFALSSSGGSIGVTSYTQKYDTEAACTTAGSAIWRAVAESSYRAQAVFTCTKINK